MDIRIKRQGQQNRKKVSEFEDLAIQTIQNREELIGKKNVPEYQLWDNLKQPKIIWNPETGNQNRKKYWKKYWLHIFQIYGERLARRYITLT